MPVVLPGGTTIEQKVVTVANVDATINTEIDTQGADGWLLGFVTVWTDNTKVILFFSRTNPPPA